MKQVDLVVIPKISIEDALTYTALVLRDFGVENRQEILEELLEYMTWLTPSEARRLLGGEPLQ